ncbi:MAG: endonuclease/exonuclease/phosphatase family protein [Planktothrix sp. GU0601_MAG3]|nr:MAG: endonuclease/exonuclease/phosphatase family protein [Planktothrix sp. GU0601_MAG3]
MKIITLNLRYDKPDKGNNDWKFRRYAIAKLIEKYEPDIIGTQEGKAHQILDLHRLLPQYQSVGTDQIGNGTGEHCAIFYQTKKFQCIESKNFWLSDTPKLVGSISSEWGNSTPKLVSWGVFISRETQQKITVFNTHLDYYSQGSRKLSIPLIQKYLNQVNPEYSLLILTGDFNAEPNSEERNALLQPLANGIQLLDSLSDIPLESQQTFHDFTGEAIAAVDTIYYDHRMLLESVNIDVNQIEDIWPSDHFPVIVRFSVKNSILFRH